jgi:hypothetical protein
VARLRSKFAASLVVNGNYCQLDLISGIILIYIKIFICMLFRCKRSALCVELYSVRPALTKLEAMFGVPTWIAILLKQAQTYPIVAIEHRPVNRAERESLVVTKTFIKNTRRRRWL